MAYAAGTVKTVISGVLVGGEQFAFGFQANLGSSAGQLALTQYNGVVSGSLTGNLLTTTIKALLPSTTRFTTVTSYLYTGGSTASLVAQNAGINTAGTGTTSPMPNQCAIVVSLLTGIPGRSTRGRAYFPGWTGDQIIASTGQLSSTSSGQLAAAWGAFLSGVKDTTNGAPPVVASSLHGTVTPIVQVAVDTIIDTQRRRRDKMVPTARPTATVS